MSASPVTAVGAIGAETAALARTSPVAARPTGESFSQMLLGGVERVDRQLNAADAKVAAFAIDDSIPPHEVIFALQQARQSLELVLQVRAHLVEGFQEVMRMQL